MSAEKKTEKALGTAVAAIYLNDNSDYIKALWSIVRILGGDEAADLLSVDEQAAYTRYATDPDVKIQNIPKRPFKKGDIVDYHSIIGGPITSRGNTVTRVGKLSSGDRVAWLEGRTGGHGCVSLDALSHAPQQRSAEREKALAQIEALIEFVEDFGHLGAELTAHLTTATAAVKILRGEE